MRDDMEWVCKDAIGKGAEFHMTGVIRNVSSSMKRPARAAANGEMVSFGYLQDLFQMSYLRGVVNGIDKANPVTYCLAN